ncbi:MAG: hypothetical protein WBQ17_12115 [Rhizomicrobium sp.]|jgi:hypothetical protein
MWKEPINSALIWARRTTNLASLDPASYRATYSSLLKLFADFVDLEDYESVLCGALAVYGWMPTMLKNPPTPKQWDEHKAVLSDLRSSENWDGADEILVNHQNVLKFVNNSVVGTSKFLHFSNPNVFPIWDSRIARCVGLRHQYQLNDVGNYLSYGRAMSEALRAGFQIPQRFSGFMGDVSPVRKLEMLLFLYSKTIR